MESAVNMEVSWIAEEAVGYFPWQQALFTGSVSPLKAVAKNHNFSSPC